MLEGGEAAGVGPLSHSPELACSLVKDLRWVPMRGLPDFSDIRQLLTCQQ